jgi:CubicO group peptidase (beta-lactamase class C family)
VLNDGWRVAADADKALDAQALCRALQQAIDPDANLHGIVVERAGKLQFEAYFDGSDNPGASFFSRPASFAPDDLHDVRSVTKSIVGLLFGIALERGLIKSLDTPVFDFFPEHTDLKTPERARITLAHLLTMTHGLDWDESGSYLRPGNTETQMRFSREPDRFVLEREVVAPPGSRFQYSGGATQLLGDVLVRVTRLPLERFADEVLFQPLGIRHTAWRRDLNDRVTPYGGLRLRPRDLAKIGRMVLDRGRWNGKQVVPAGWIDEALRDRVPAGALRYGYQWWRTELKGKERSVTLIAAMGNGGQRLYLAPELDLVVVVTAGQYNRPETSGKAPWLVFRQVAAALAASDGAR